MQYMYSILYCLVCKSGKTFVDKTPARDLPILLTYKEMYLDALTPTSHYSYKNRYHAICTQGCSQFLTYIFGLNIHIH
jgi:hypothetical protein